MNILITGGAGFIGSNVARSFLEEGHDVVIMDNLSRTGVRDNLNWLSEFPKLQFFNHDISVEFPAPLVDFDVVFHFAAQVGVQSSLSNPTHDFKVNAWGTFWLLENIRKMKTKPLVVFASTNKVYGDIQIDRPVSEDQPLSFCTPYGCSKGAADQYMLDYHRVYGVNSVVLRMSCIYGERQMGTEEQGWLCHFMRRREESVTIYGDGSQMRDILYIDDYVGLMHTLVDMKERVAGQVFNIGGGRENVISISRALRLIGNKNVFYKDWRPSDQKYYVSDISKIRRFTRWRPQIDEAEGLKRLEQWIKKL